MTLSCHELCLSLTPKFNLGPLTHRFCSNGITAVVGPNGSGKSSFFRLIAGLEEASQGEARFCGEIIRPESHQYKRRIGYLPQPLELPLWVSARDVLHYIASLRGADQALHSIEELMQLFGIHSYQHQPLVACSYGMKKRVALALALLTEPELLILDEPLSGLDVLHIASLRCLLQKRRAASKPTIISTHILSFACEEATEILLMKSGRWHTLPSWKELSYSQRRAHLGDFFKAEGQQATRRRG